VQRIVGRGIQVVERVETYDAISEARLVTSYRYHHGHYDTAEREFRGFGMVETIDAETFAPGEGQGSFPTLPHDEHGELKQDPILTKSWFHTGAFLERTSLEAAFAAERWTGDSVTPIACVLPSGLTPNELREAHRALKGASCAKKSTASTAPRLNRLRTSSARPPIR
jgi:hypothetical protein